MYLRHLFVTLNRKGVIVAKKAKKLYKIFKADKGELWGVCGINGGLLYEADNDKVTAQMICDINNEHPAWGWNQTRDEMERRGWVDPLSAQTEKTQIPKQ